MTIVVLADACTQAAGEPMTWWQALLMTAGIVLLTFVLFRAIFGGPR